VHFFCVNGLPLHRPGDHTSSLFFKMVNNVKEVNPCDLPFHPLTSCRFHSDVLLPLTISNLGSKIANTGIQKVMRKSPFHAGFFHICNFKKRMVLVVFGTEVLIVRYDSYTVHTNSV
jgi:hypothetical protein